MRFSCMGRRRVPLIRMILHLSFTRHAAARMKFSLIDWLLVILQARTGRVTTDQEALNTGIIRGHLIHGILLSISKESHRVLANPLDACFESGVQFPDPRGLHCTPKQDQENNKPSEGALVNSVPLWSLASLVPTLPVLPGRIRVDVRPVWTTSARRMRGCDVSLGIIAPTSPRMIVRRTPDRIGEDFMCGNDDAISLRSNLLRNMPA